MKTINRHPAIGGVPWCGNPCRERPGEQRAFFSKEGIRGSGISRHRSRLKPPLRRASAFFFGIRDCFRAISIVLLSLATVHAAERVAITEQQMRNLGIELGKPELAADIPLFKAPAQVIIPPAHEFIVSAPQDGLVSKVEAAIGDRVNKGQILARLHSPDLVTLQRNLLNAISERNLARAQLRRDEMLLKEGVIPERRWQETRSRYNVHSNTLNEARQLLAIAGMNGSEIDILERTRRLTSVLNVSSPVEGVVLDKMIVAGQRLDAMTPMFRVANLETLWLEVNVPQERLHEVKLGDRVVVEQTDCRARVVLIGQNVNPNNQSVLVRAVIDRTTTPVRPGQTVSVRFVQPGKAPAFKIAAAALARSGTRNVIFVRSGHGFEIRDVELVGHENQSVIVRGDLNAGEDVAVSGVVALKADWLGLGGDE
ncbi:MAG: efflux RND transporter periplasmic adaptor subunit [Pseudomonadota bacterium]